MALAGSSGVIMDPYPEEVAQSADGGSQRLKSVLLDSLVRATDDLLYLKLDIEGAEPAALREGAGAVLSAVRYIYMEVSVVPVGTDDGAWAGASTMPAVGGFHFVTENSAMLANVTAHGLQLAVWDKVRDLSYNPPR